MEIKDIGPSYRKENETFQDYKIRQRKENRFIKQYLKGKNIWNAAIANTYRKPKKQI